MKKKVIFTLLFTLFISFSFARRQDLGIDLAKQVLFETNRIMSAKSGEMANYTNEVLAFNIIYRTSNADSIFKEVYRCSNSAGKFYALIGLFLKKDKDFEKLKTDFLNSKQESVYCQYGCKASADIDVKYELNTWLEGIPKGLWYTKIVLGQQE
jgi:hypothetical protein